jgi:bacterioferritin-associated ferredoxin
MSEFPAIWHLNPAARPLQKCGQCQAHDHEMFIQFVLAQVQILHAVDELLRDVPVGADCSLN